MPSIHHPRPSTWVRVCGTVLAAAMLAIPAASHALTTEIYVIGNIHGAPEWGFDSLEVQLPAGRYTSTMLSRAECAGQNDPTWRTTGGCHWRSQYGVILEDGTRFGGGSGQEEFCTPDEAYADAVARERTVTVFDVPVAQNVGFYVADSIVFDNAGGLCLRIESHDAILLRDGSQLNGSTIDPAAPHITVETGSSLSGTLLLRANNARSPGAVVPVAGTFTWGDRAIQPFQVAPHVFNGWTDLPLPINATAPDEPGTYYIVVASGGQCDFLQVISGTHWALPGSPVSCGVLESGPIWNDGNDLGWDWTPTHFQQALDSGWVTQDIWMGRSGEFQETEYGATWIEVEVVAPVFIDLVGDEQTIAATGALSGQLTAGDRFGESVAVLGDIDGEGGSHVTVAIGSPAASGTGAVWVLQLDDQLEIASASKIQSPFATQSFGDSVISLGDLDGDGPATHAIAVGDSSRGDGGPGRGAVWVFFLTADGSVSTAQRISDTEGAFAGRLDDGDGFGASLAPLGDLDGTGTAATAVAVGAPGDSDAGADRGAVWVLFLAADGTVLNEQKINDVTGGFSGFLRNGDSFSRSIASAGDLDGNLIPELAVSAPSPLAGDPRVYILFLDAAGTVTSDTQIRASALGSDTQDLFGESLASLGDHNQDGTPDLMIGTPNASGGAGGFVIAYLAPDGTLRCSDTVTQSIGGLIGPAGPDGLGQSAAAYDMDGEYPIEIVLGAPDAPSGGAATLLDLNTPNPICCGQEVGCESITKSVPSFSLITTDTEGDGTTPADPIETWVLSPNAGTVRIVESSPLADEGHGYRLVDRLVKLTIPPATKALPIDISFELHPSLWAEQPSPNRPLQLFRNGERVRPCQSGSGASPDPCRDDDGETNVLSVRTSRASLWSLDFGGCSRAPQTSCRQAAESTLAIDDRPRDGNDRIVWRWLRGEETTSGAFGDPAESDDLSLCLYDESGAEPVEILAATARAMDGCPDCWRRDGSNSGHRYRDSGARQDGLTKILLQPGRDGRAKIVVRARGENIVMPGEGTEHSSLPLSLPLLAQLQASNGQCWEARFEESGSRRNDTFRFRGTTD